MHIYTPNAPNMVARAVLTPLMILLVLVPVIICNAVQNATARLGIIIASTTVFLTVLSLLTRGKMLDLVIAGAT